MRSKRSLTGTAGTTRGSGRAVRKTDGPDSHVHVYRTDRVCRRRTSRLAAREIADTIAFLQTLSDGDLNANRNHRHRRRECVGPDDALWQTEVRQILRT